MGRLRRKHFRKRPTPRPSPEEDVDDGMTSGGKHHGDRGNMSGKHGGGGGGGGGGNDDGGDNEQHASEFVGLDSGEFEQDVFSLCSSCEEALSVWPQLTPSDKFTVLEVDNSELAVHLHKSMPMLSSDQLQTLIRKVFKNKKIMMGCRAQFLLGVTNSGVIPDFHYDPITMAIMQTMENHLMLFYRRRESRVRIFGVGVVWMWFFCDWYRVVRVIVVIVCWYVLSGMGLGEHERVKRIVDTVMLPFESDNAERMRAKVHSFLVAWLTFIMGYWMSAYAVAIVVSLVPMVLIEIETCTQGDDATALGKMRSFVQWIPSIVLVYLSWYSWLLFLCIGIFVAPNISLSLLGIVLAVCGIVVSVYKWVSGLIFGQSRKMVTIVLTVLLGAPLLYYNVEVPYFWWLLSVWLLSLPQTWVEIVYNVQKIAFMYFSDRSMGALKLQNSIVFGGCLVLAVCLSAYRYIKRRLCGDKSTSTAS